MNLECSYAIGQADLARTLPERFEIRVSTDNLASVQVQRTLFSAFTVKIRRSLLDE